MYDFVKKLISDNHFFFSSFGIALLVGGGLLLYVNTGDELWYWSARRSPFRDFMFRYGTQLAEGITYAFLIIAGLFVRVRYAILFFATGFFAGLISFATKWVFGHDRPSVFLKKQALFDQISLVEGVHLYGGPTSFPSGHTMSAFAVFGLLAFLLPRKRVTGTLLFALALLVAVSRIYLVQHFLKDVYLGSILGVLLAAALYYVHLQFPENTPHWYNASLPEKLRQRKSRA